jgi:flagella synthesis protein FlgN
MIKKTYPIALKLLENGLALSIELQELLVKEENELKQNTDPNRLSTIVVNKKEKVSQLEKFSKQFAQVLSSEKLSMTTSGIDIYFSLAEKANLNASKLTALWQKIVSSSKKSQLLNQKNGASINILAQYTHRSLHILKGKSQQATTYGPDGSTYNEQDTSPTLTSV